MLLWGVRTSAHLRFQGSGGTLGTRHGLGPDPLGDSHVQEGLLDKQLQLLYNSISTYGTALGTRGILYRYNDRLGQHERLAYIA
jgi:hypothetical protein